MLKKSSAMEESAPEKENILLKPPLDRSALKIIARRPE